MEERESLTVYLPTELLTQAKLYKAQNESLNDLAIAALEQEVSHRKGLAAHQRIIARREQIKQKTGIQSSSINLIRQLRVQQEELPHEYYTQAD